MQSAYKGPTVKSKEKSTSEFRNNLFQCTVATTEFAQIALCFLKQEVAAAHAKSHLKSNYRLSSTNDQ